MTFSTTETAWCPGCGNHDILATLADVLNDMQKGPEAISPHNVLLVGGIGQAAKTNQYLTANGFSGLHGRSLPAAAAAKIVNSGLTVIVDTGDGDSYGEGGNHFIHNIRRNTNITHLVHDNQVYGLTKGQVSPTSNSCEVQPHSACNLNYPLNPLLLALAAGATFVARSFSGNEAHLRKIIHSAIRHEGYALVDILQPCVSFNKVNNYAYYSDRVYELEQGYDPTDQMAAMKRAIEWGDKIPLGILYQVQRPDYAAMRPELFGGIPLIDEPRSVERLQSLVQSFT